jgi:hypothetical protein
MVSFNTFYYLFCILHYFNHIYIGTYFTSYQEYYIDITYILPQHDLTLLSCIIMFLYTFYTITVLVYIYCIILLYSDLPPTILTLK